MPILEEQSSDMSWIWQVNREEERDGGGGDDWQSSFLARGYPAAPDVVNWQILAFLQHWDVSPLPVLQHHVGTKKGRKEGTLKSAKSTNKRGSQPLTPSTFFMYIILTSIWRPTTIKGLMKEKTSRNPKDLIWLILFFILSSWLPPDVHIMKNSSTDKQS